MAETAPPATFDLLAISVRQCRSGWLGDRSVNLGLTLLTLTEGGDPEGGTGSSIMPAILPWYLHATLGILTTDEGNSDFPVQVFGGGTPQLKQKRGEQKYENQTHWPTDGSLVC
jgi:hypothetical protein